MNRMTSEWMEWHRNDEMRLEWVEWHQNEWNDIGMNEMTSEWIEWHRNEWNDIGMNGMRLKWPVFEFNPKFWLPKSGLPIGRELKIEASHWSRGPQKKNLRLWPWFENLSHFYLVQSSQCRNSGVTSEWMEWHQNDEMMLEWMECHL